MKYRACVFEQKEECLKEGFADSIDCFETKVICRRYVGISFLDSVPWGEEYMYVLWDRETSRQTVGETCNDELMAKEQQGGG